MWHPAKLGHNARVEKDDARFDTFLQDDLYDSLRWLFIGAIAWCAGQSNEKIPHQSVLGMHTSMVQARALYEFYFSSAGSARPDDARAANLVWRPRESEIYKRYMANGKAANKRMFHLVLGRDGHSGGTDDGQVDDLNRQVLAFALDLLGLTRDLVESLAPPSQQFAKASLDDALREAEVTAAAYGIENPFFNR